jgi:hypothetical protein
VVRTLRKLRNDGMIEVVNTLDVAIRDPVALQCLADGSHLGERRVQAAFGLNLAKQSPVPVSAGVR